VGSWEKLQVIAAAGDGEMNVRVKVNRPNGWKAGSVVRNPLNYRNQWRWAEFYWDDRIAGSETEGCALYDSALQKITEAGFEPATFGRREREIY
jgi:hypothetical protein